MLQKCSHKVNLTIFAVVPRILTVPENLEGEHLSDLIFLSSKQVALSCKLATDGRSDGNGC